MKRIADREDRSESPVRPDVAAAAAVRAVLQGLGPVVAADTRLVVLGSFGSLGGNIFVSPNVYNWDYSIFKNFAVREGQQVQFRAEIYNLFNTPQFGPPSAVLSSPSTFGQSRSTLTSSTGFGTNRQIQLALRYSF